VRKSKLIVLFLFFLVFCQITLAEQDKEEIALTASKSWLTLIDEGRYSESWEKAATYFKNAVGKEQWKKLLVAFRKPLGKVLSRKLISKRYTKTLPGTPDGEYVVVQYRTRFENKSIGIETVTPMLDGDGKWRVSGYYIK